MSNYPPGVTGREFEISGPDREWDETRYCDVCEKDTEHECWSHRDRGAWAVCSDCGHEVDITPDMDEGPDPDDERDEMLDRQMWED